MSNQNEFIDLIKVSDSLKEIDITNLKNNTENNAFILCKNSFINYEILINKFINKQLTKDEIILINNNSPKFYFTFKEIISFINKIDIYIVDRNYLIHRGIDQKFLISNLFYYIQDGKRYLYFFENSKLFMISPVKVTKLQNQKNNNQNINISLNNFLNNRNNTIIMGNEFSEINNNHIRSVSPNINIINNNNLNDNKINILNCLILLYANERLIKKRLFPNIHL